METARRCSDLRLLFTGSKSPPVRKHQAGGRHVSCRDNHSRSHDQRPFKSQEEPLRGLWFGSPSSCSSCLLPLLPLPAPLPLSTNKTSFNPKPGSRSENVFVLHPEPAPGSSEHFLSLITGRRSAQKHSGEETASGSHRLQPEVLTRLRLQRSAPSSRQGPAG